VQAYAVAQVARPAGEHQGGPGERKAGQSQPGQRGPDDDDQRQGDDVDQTAPLPVAVDRAGPVAEQQAAAGVDVDEVVASPGPRLRELVGDDDEQGEARERRPPTRRS